MGRIFINKHFPILKAGVEEKEEHVIYGVVLEPETYDAQGHIISVDEVKKSAHKFMEEHGTWGGNWKVEHSANANWDVVLLETYLAPADIVMEGSDGEEHTIKKGSWVMSHRVESRDLWDQIKSGDLTGYSIGGRATHHDVQKSIAKSSAGVEKMDLDEDDDKGDDDPQRLTDLDVDEVSLVGRGANQKRYILIKNERGLDGSTTEHLIDSAELLRANLDRVITIAKSDQGKDEDVRDILDGIGQSLCIIAKGNSEDEEPAEEMDTSDDELDPEDEVEAEDEDSEDDTDDEDSDDSEDVEDDSEASDDEGDDETLTKENLAEVVKAEVAKHLKAIKVAAKKKKVAKSKGKKKAKTPKSVQRKRKTVAKAKPKSKPTQPRQGNVLKSLSERIAKLEQNVGTPNSQPPGEVPSKTRRRSNDDWPIDFNQSSDADDDLLF